jgi:hypothetical protein
VLHHTAIATLLLRIRHVYKVFPAQVLQTEERPWLPSQVTESTGSDHRHKIILSSEWEMRQHGTTTTMRGRIIIGHARATQGLKYAVGA